MRRHADDLEGKSVIISVFTVRLACRAVLKQNVVYAYALSLQVYTSYATQCQDFVSQCLDGQYAKAREKSHEPSPVCTCLLLADKSCTLVYFFSYNFFFLFNREYRVLTTKICR